MTVRTALWEGLRRLTDAIPWPTAALSVRSGRNTFRRPFDADKCGCAMGARFLVAALIGSSLWFLWLGATPTLSLAGALLRIFGGTFAAAALGKMVGMALHRIRESRRPLFQLGRHNID